MKSQRDKRRIRRTGGEKVRRRFSPSVGAAATGESQESESGGAFRIASPADPWLPIERNARLSWDVTPDT